MTLLKPGIEQKMNSKPLVLYHAGCWDGFCAAWVFRNHKDRDAEFVPVQYGSQPPDVSGRVVYILDFSYPRDVLLAMHKVAHSLVVLDHHKTAQAALDGLSFCRFDMDKSGARLTWEHFCGDEPAPWQVYYTEDRDLWLWRQADSKEINAALRSYPLTFEAWDELDATPGIISDLIIEGRAILRAENQIVNGLAAQAHETEIAGHKVLMVNATVFASEIAGKLAIGRPFGVVWFEGDDRERVYSLRSAPDGIDVSEIAKSYGGGGHKHAAGFRVSATGATGLFSAAPVSEND